MGNLHRTDAGQQRADHPGLFGLIVGLAGDLGLGAARGLNGGTGRTLPGRRAFDCRAARARAGRALTDLARLVACADAGRAGRYCRLQNVLGHVGRCRALGLQHVARHVGLRRARRNRRTQHVFGPVDRRAALVIIGVSTRALAPATATRATVTGLALADIAVGLGDIYEVLVPLRIHLKVHQHGTYDEADSKNTGIWKYLLQGHATLTVAAHFACAGSG